VTISPNSEVDDVELLWKPVGVGTRRCPEIACRDRHRNDVPSECDEGYQLRSIAITVSIRRDPFVHLPHPDTIPRDVGRNQCIDHERRRAPTAQCKRRSPPSTHGITQSERNPIRRRHGWHVTDHDLHLPSVVGQADSEMYRRATGAVPECRYQASAAGAAGGKEMT
jgi:hypothetical protein